MLPYILLGISFSTLILSSGANISFTNEKVIQMLERRVIFLDKMQSNPSLSYFYSSKVSPKPVSSRRTQYQCNPSAGI